MYLDFKVTVWERAIIPAEHEQEVIEALQEGKINNSADLAQFDWEPEFETMYDTSQQMETNQNGRLSTIEMLDEGDEKAIWKNGN